MSLRIAEDPKQRKMLTIVLSCVIVAAVLALCWSTGLLHFSDSPPVDHSQNAPALLRQGAGTPGESGSSKQKRNRLGGDEP
jgi:hypothetical protein